uniref:Uncharacterized protein n=1 Tax=Monodelphis domestica TaxID=13616 RepID=A0A5F8H4D5_MONDO
MESISSPRVVLTDSTKVTLNQRFSDMLKNKPLVPQQFRKQQQQQLNTTTTSGSRNRKFAQQLDNISLVNSSLTLKAEKQLGKNSTQAHLGWPAKSLARGSVAEGRDLPSSQNTLPCGSVRGGRGGRARDLASPVGQDQPQDGEAATPPLGLRRGSNRGQKSPGRLDNEAFSHRPLPRGLLARDTLAGGRVVSVCGVIGEGSRSGGGRGSSLPPLTKEHIDNQLDAYIMESKGPLENEIEECLAQSVTKGSD